MPIVSSFAGSQLNVIGDGLANTVTVSRNAAGKILINNGAVPVLGGTPTIANTSLIQVSGLDGDDTLSLNEANGALPAARLYGGAGNDKLTGGSRADQLFGQSGDDSLLGAGGNDLLSGGDGNDTLTGGDGNDQMFGGGGDDRMIWNPGDDNDLVEGGSGIDTAQANGSNGDEVLTVTANGGRVRFDRLEPAPSYLDIGTTEKLVVNANGGNDRMSATGNLSALIELTFDGGSGNDTILGGNGNDELLGGDGNDFVDGNQGADVAMLGAGDDTFQWDPGDSNDVVEGQDGTDTLLFHGSSIGETIDISANGERVLFTRNIASIATDLNDVETIKFAALGGPDYVTVHDLTGTDVQQVAVNLAGITGAGDGQADTVIAHGTNDGDAITVSAAGSLVTVQGLFAQLTVDHAELGDKLIISGLAGDDTIDASALPAGTIGLLLGGDDGDDVVLGSANGDTLLGGLGGDNLFGNDGDDWISGGVGDDLLFGGAGNDTFSFDTSLDGYDVILDFDGDPEGGQDVFTLDALFDGLQVADLDRINRVSISDNGDSVNIFVDADNIAANGFEVLAATLQTTDAVTLGQDVNLGTLI